MVYVRGMTETCGHLASIRTKAAKDKMPKLKRIVELWNARCKEISLRAEDQLRSMGDESESVSYTHLTLPTIYSV